MGQNAVIGSTSKECLALLMAVFLRWGTKKCAENRLLIYSMRRSRVTFIRVAKYYDIYFGGFFSITASTLENTEEYTSLAQMTSMCS